MIPAVCLLITSSFFFKLIIFFACSFKDSENVFMQSLPWYTSCLFSISSNVVDIKRPDGICSPTFTIDVFSELFLHPSIFFLSKIQLRSAELINGVLSNFWYRINSNIFVSSEGITTLQKSLFSHSFLCNSSLFFVLKLSMFLRSKRAPWGKVLNKYF